MSGVIFTENETLIHRIALNFSSSISAGLCSLFGLLTIPALAMVPFLNFFPKITSMEQSISGIETLVMAMLFFVVSALFYFCAKQKLAAHCLLILIASILFYVGFKSAFLWAIISIIIFPLVIAVPRLYSGKNEI